MWVSNSRVVEPANSLFNLLSLSLFINSFSHKLKALNSPLTWAFATFPQINPLVTTTTYRYIDQPVRFPILTFLNLNYLKIKTCKVLQVREG